ncbi:MAG: hypothetical protein RMJ55_17105, partial [Roseiflexaceae bacterium]|nr:hypothetical protein [Roseiflexaceae bacterium]
LERRLTQTAHVVDERRLRRSHAAWLLVIAGASLGMGGVALVVRLEIGITGALILGTLAILGLSRMMALLRRMNQDVHQ